MTLTVNQDGTLVLPPEIRRQLGLEAGGEVELVSAANGVLLLSDQRFEGEAYTPERKAELLFNNAMTKEEWDEIAELVRADGLDPQNIPYIDPANRESLPTLKEYEDRLAASYRERQKVSA